MFRGEDNMDIKLKDLIIPAYDSVFIAIMKHMYVHYCLKGGRGSTKSSFIGGIVIPLLIMQYPRVNAVCFRKVGNTVQNSIYSQITWGIYQMGLESLFHIPKTYSNPIVYKPTGQKIFFMGMDDPNKVKSIKVERGYIGITWWEELDQFAGEAELRKVLQSTMRGGDLFWDFRTFNPPISIDNWANEYADEAENKKNTLVVHNTYLDVPVEWLGQQFIEEAEDLKEVNPTAYEHEYMGVPTGTGGGVFPNACDLDMEELVDIVDFDGTPKKVPLWTTFDKIYNGIDWGGVNDLVTADSAEQKSIADFKAYGAYIKPAIKGPDSVRYGIKWLQGLNHIYIDKRRCPKTYKEFTHYEYCQDREGNWISDYPDENNHSIDAVRYALERYCNKRGN